MENNKHYFLTVTYNGLLLTEINIIHCQVWEVCQFYEKNPHLVGSSLIKHRKDSVPPHDVVV